MASIRKGDNYSLPIRITVNGSALDIQDVDLVEFMFGTLRKVYSDTSTDGITFAVDHFDIPLTQEETFSFEGKEIVYQARVKFVDGSVRGTPEKKYNIFNSISKEVL